MFPRTTQQNLFLTTILILAYSILTTPLALSEEAIPMYFKNKASSGIASEFYMNGELVVGKTLFDFDDKKIMVIWFEHYYGSYDKFTYKHHFTPKLIEYNISHFELVNENEMSMKGPDFSAHLTSDLKFELTDDNRGFNIINISEEGRKIQDKYFANIDLAYPH